MDHRHQIAEHVQESTGIRHTQIVGGIDVGIKSKLQAFTESQLTTVDFL